MVSFPGIFNSSSTPASAGNDDTLTTSSTETPSLHLPPAPAPAEEQPPPAQQVPRLNLFFPQRIALFSFVSFSSGFLLGSTLGGPTAALRYRAENAHRLPTSPAGWYLYHKSKNYHAIVGGTVKGVKVGAKMTGWGGLFLVVEEALDRYRARKDWASSSLAGLTMAGLFCVRHHWGDLYTSARTLRIALVGGAGFGVCQDLLGWARGDVPWYVGWVKKKIGGDREHDDKKTSVMG